MGFGIEWCPMNLKTHLCLLRYPRRRLGKRFIDWTYHRRSLDSRCKLEVVLLDQSTTDGLAFIILFFYLDIKSPNTPLIEGLKAIDWVGSVLVIDATLMFLSGIQYGGETHPWGSAVVVCLIFFGIVTFALYLLYEWKVHKYPIMALGFLNSRTNAATLYVAFIHGLVFISENYYLPLYFQAVRGASPVFSGVYLLPTALAASSSSFGAGIFVRKVGAYLPPIWFGFFMMTLGYGLLVDLDASSNWPKIVLYQIIAASRFGTATTTLGFIRQMATSISVVIGQAVYQNSMSTRTDKLAASLGPELAAQLSGGEAGANARAIDALPGSQRDLVRNALAKSLQPMWMMYTVISFIGLMIGFLIHKKALSTQHEEPVTGLAVEQQNAAARAAEKEAKRESKKAGLPVA